MNNRNFIKSLMKTKKYLLLISIVFLVYSDLFAWTSSNEGVCYTMDTLCLLSDSISYNPIDEMYEVDCDIIILGNDTLKIWPGEIVKFLSYPGGPPIRYELIIYGNLKAIGDKEKNITLGDPEANFSSGNWWQGIKFLNTSHNGESVLKHCDVRGAVNLEPNLETMILCEDSSPIFDHCTFQYLGSGEFTGGASAIGLRGQSYPLISYCTFKSVINGVAIWCNPYNIQDTINYPSPLMIGCNFLASISGIQWTQSDHDKVVLFGGFLDNCYLGVGPNYCDTTLGNPIDTIGDGVCTTTSTYEFKPRFLLVDGVVNPRDTFLMTGIKEEEINILPTTSNYLVLKNNYPNPFSNYTTIEFEIKNNSSVINLLVYDSKGMLVKKLIRKKTFANGTYTVNWYGDDENGNKVKKGVYFYKLISGNNLKVKKAILVKSTSP